jgi:hypothetical protein
MVHSVLHAGIARQVLLTRCLAGRKEVSSTECLATHLRASDLNTTPSDANASPSADSSSLSPSREVLQVAAAHMPWRPESPSDPAPAAAAAAAGKMCRNMSSARLSSDSRTGATNAGRALPEFNSDQATPYMDCCLLVPPWALHQQHPRPRPQNCVGTASPHVSADTTVAEGIPKSRTMGRPTLALFHSIAVHNPPHPHRLDFNAGKTPALRIRHEKFCHKFPHHKHASQHDCALPFLVKPDRLQNSTPVPHIPGMRSGRSMRSRCDGGKCGDKVTPLHHHARWVNEQLVLAVVDLWVPPLQRSKGRLGAERLHQTYAPTRILGPASWQFPSLQPNTNLPDTIHDNSSSTRATKQPVHPYAPPRASRPAFSVLDASCSRYPSPLFPPPSTPVRLRVSGEGALKGFTNHLEVGPAVADAHVSELLEQLRRRWHSPRARVDVQD